jgi:ABC-2 type transport system ATP-binding protein
MIRIENITKKFGDFTAVDDISFQVKDGEVFGLLGPNGAGKSTTLKMMTGILKPTKGDIFIDDYSIVKNSLEAKKHIGFVPDSPDMFLGMRGIDYLAFVCSIYGMDMDAGLKDSQEMAKRFHIEEALTDYIANYSHGMRQKLFLIGALVHSPSCWILDEPLTGLDPEGAFDVKEMMKEHTKAGKSVLFSTHVLDVAEKICDRIGIISKGKILFIGTLEELKAKEQEENSSLEQLFLELVK